MRTGCSHNLERTIVHAPRGVDGKGVRKYVVGDVMKFICPRGCPDIVLEVVTTEQQKRRG